MPDPTYANDLVLCSVFLKHDAIAREAEVTFAINDASNNSSAQEWADAVQGVFTSRFDQQVDTAARIMRTETLKGDGSATFTTGVSTSAPVRGTNAMSSTPPNCAILAKKLTGFGGRRNRGRFYLPFMLNEGEVDEAGNISTGVVTDVQACCDNFRSDIEAADDATLVIANRNYDVAWNIKPRHLVSTDMGEVVTAFVVESVVATQRRRMPR
jgi:hypothetical protein